MTNKTATALILSKLRSLIEEEADFVMTRWIFEWDDSLSDVDNSLRANKELEALQKLRVYGCINLRIEENPVIHLTEEMVAGPTFKEYRFAYSIGTTKYYAKYGGQDDYHIARRSFNDPGCDKAWAHYDEVVFITDINHEALNHYEAEYLNPTIKAVIEVKYGQVNVNVGGIRYNMQQMSNGSKPMALVEYLAQKPGVRVTKFEVKRIPHLQDINQITEVFENHKLFHKKNGILKDFVEQSPTDILLKNECSISKETEARIAKEAKSSEPIA